MPITTVNKDVSGFAAELLGDIVWAVLRWLLHYAVYEYIVAPVLGLPSLSVIDFFVIVVLIRFVLGTNKIKVSA